jgi:hypothetical protein
VVCQPEFAIEPPLASTRRRVVPSLVLSAALLCAALVCGLSVLGAAFAQPSRIELGRGQPIAAGVTFYRPNGASVLGLPTPLAIQALALDPRLVDLTTALALGHAQGRGAVLDAAAREAAVAAVNAGFFVLASGDPTGILRIDGDLVSDARLMRGAVAIRQTDDGMRLTFGRARVGLLLEVWDSGLWRRLTLAGVDTVRHAGRATLYTSRFGPDTGTPSSGVEWPLKLMSRTGTPGNGVTGTVVGRITGGKTPIPSDGAVLSFGGASPPRVLDHMRKGTAIRVRQEWKTESANDLSAFSQAEDVVGGAGLLIKGGRVVADWSAERTSESLRTIRHPRTMIGTDANRTIWLVTVDGRQPTYSMGVTLQELQQLALAMGLTNALNLDGGGSTTMVVGGAIMNRPSDALGPRAVSDVLLVRSRPARPPAVAR